MEKGDVSVGKGSIVLVLRKVLTKRMRVDMVLISFVLRALSNSQFRQWTSSPSHVLRTTLSFWSRLKWWLVFRLYRCFNWSDGNYMLLVLSLPEPFFLYSTRYVEKSHP
jgi:hypothetical protein